MSKGKKKKHGGHQGRFDLAELKRNFLKRIEAICTLVAGPGACDMIPREELNLMFTSRFLPVKIIPAPDEQIPPDVLKIMRILFVHLNKDKKVPLFKDGPEIALTEYHTAGSTLLYFIRHPEHNYYPKAPGFEKAMEKFSSYFEEAEENANWQSNEILRVMSLMSCDLASCLYWVNEKYRPRYHDRFGGIEDNVIVHSHKPERINVTFDGLSRQAIKVCWPSPSMEGIDAIRIKSELLGLNCDGQDSQLDIYIQVHALQRLNERLDCIGNAIAYVYLCLSLLEPSVQREDGHTFLIEYRLVEVKAGYLVAEIKDGVVIIKTFLFLTNGGTPEGRKLHEICGLGRLDREFLSIDKLSTFMATDLKSDKELERLFLEAGCDCLLELHDKAAYLVHKIGIESALPALRKYFGLESKRDFMTPDLLDKFRRRFEVEQ